MSTDAVVLAEVIRRSNPVGTMAPFQNVGTEFTTAASATWLRTGVAKAAAGYPQAAAEPSLQMFGSPVTTPPAQSTWYDIASDGGNNYVICVNSNTSVYVSTDGGATWSTLAHNLGAMSATSACWDATNSLWLIAGNDGTNLKISTTPNLATAATLRFTGTPVSPVASTAIIRSSGGKSIAVCNAGSNAAAYTSNGTAWTAASLALSASPTGLAKVGTRWMVGVQGTTNAPYSDDDGATWPGQQTIPAAPTTFVGGNGLFVGIGSGGAVYYSATGNTGTWAASTLAGGISTESPINGKCIGGYVDGVWRFASQAGIIETSDLITTRIKRTPTDMSTQTPIAVFGTGGKFVIGYGAATPAAVSGSSLTTATYVGTPKLLSTLATYALGVPVYYARIK